MELRLRNVVGHSPRLAQRPDLPFLVRWLKNRAAPGEQIEAAVFTAISPGEEKDAVPSIVKLRRAGMRVFVKPRPRGADGLDQDMAAYLAGHLGQDQPGQDQPGQDQPGQDQLAEIIIASHQPKAFVPGLEQAAAQGVAVTVLAFWEQESISMSVEVSVLDIRDIAGVFAEAIPHTDLRDLPASGRWFEPFPPAPVATGVGLASTEFPEFDPPSGVAIRTGPSREQVLRYVTGRIDAAVLDGEDGLGHATLGRKLKMRFRGIDLGQLGFGSVVGLMTELASTGPYELVKLDNGRFQLQPAPPEPSDRSQDPAEDGWLNAKAIAALKNMTTPGSDSQGSPGPTKASELN